MPHATDPNNTAPPVTAELCDWACNLTLEDVPRNVQERAKHLILDGIGCGLVGAKVPWSEEAFKAMLQFEGAGEHALIGYDEKVGPTTAALLNGSFIQATELDDYHSVAPLHSCAVVLPALLAAAEVCARPDSNNKSNPVGGQQFLLASIAGFETGPRVGNAMHGGEMLGKGWHSGPVFGAPAAAIATSKLCGLDAEQTEGATGISCTQAGGLMAAQYGGMVKRMQHAFAARNGLLGAMLARGGYKGMEKILERPYGGFYAMFSLGNRQDPAYQASETVKELGSYWHTEVIRIKLYASVGATHGLIELLKKMQTKYPNRLIGNKNLTQISKVHIKLGEAAYQHDGWKPEKRPLNTTGAQMCAAYIAAVQLVNEDVLLSHFGESKLDLDEIWSLVDRIDCSHTTEFDKKDCGCGARITISFNDGSEIEDAINMPRGFEPPLSNEEIVEKYRKLAADVVDNDRAKKIEDTILNLEKIEDMTELTKLLSGSARNALA